MTELINENIARAIYRKLGEAEFDRLKEILEYEKGTFIPFSDFYDYCEMAMTTNLEMDLGIILEENGRGGYDVYPDPNAEKIASYTQMENIRRSEEER